MLNGSGDCCEDYVLFCPVCKPVLSRKDCKKQCALQSGDAEPGFIWTGKLKLSKGCVKCKCKQKAVKVE